ncbi:MAG: winged helix-turn-helix domain-containing protein [Actinomycetota bacterium]
MSLDEGRPDGGNWTFLTNHGHVLLALYRDGDLRQRDIARLVGITEGAVHRILHDLNDCGYIDVERVGRRNHYRVNPSGSLRHPIEAGHCIGDLLERLAPAADSVPTAS